MKITSIGRAIGVAGIISVLAGCGGGDDSAGGTVSSTPTAPSADQLAFEAVGVAPAEGQYQLKWSIVSLATGLTGHIQSDHSLLTTSPSMGGPQRTVQSAPRNLTSTLPLGALADTRLLKNGRIEQAPVNGQTTVTSYAGSSVQVDTLAYDGITVAASQRRSEFTTVPLTGSLASAPDEFKQWFAVLYEQSAVLDQTKTFLPGAAYVKYTARAVGDRLIVADCIAASANPLTLNPCLTKTTLQTAMSLGVLNVNAADGTFATVEGVPTWISKAPLPSTITQTGTTTYRLYFEMYGNVYTGTAVRDNAVLYGGRWFTTGTGYTYIPHSVRLNKAAHDSLAAAVKI